MCWPSSKVKTPACYISADGGENWKLQSATSNVTARPFYFSTLVVDPRPQTGVPPGFFLSISSDGGYSFSDAGNAGGWVHSDHHALWINPKTPTKCTSAPTAACT
jgi:hypothetical protein